MTRQNVYAGPPISTCCEVVQATSRTASCPALRRAWGMTPFGRCYEIPLAIQDRSFNDDGSLFYLASREFFTCFRTIHSRQRRAADLEPEFFGNTMVVNGRTWPFLEVEPRRFVFVSTTLQLPLSDPGI